MIKRLILSLLILLQTIKIYSQEFPQNDFKSPIGGKMQISGNFGELRENHFHSGMDVRTIALPKGEIFAIADGYVSRINISAWGYGNSIYITHPNGYKSVYAHLEKFNETISQFIENKQYAREEFALNLYPNPDELPIKQGDMIAIAGNTGYSFGEHLHFEIRDTETDEPYNPFLFGWNILDNIEPEIYKVAIYPLDDTSFVDGKNAKKIISVLGNNGKYYISENNIEVYGNIYFGIEANDYLNNVDSKNAVYSVKLFIDNELYYYHFINKFSFFESRYINSLIDYEENINSKLKIQRSYVAPNNKLPIYKDVINSGVFVFNDNKVHEIKYLISDIDSNVSTLIFKVKSVSEIDKTIKYKNIKTDYTMLMSYNCENYYISDNLRITIPKNCLYENLYFNYNKTESKTSQYSEIHNIHNDKTPLHNPLIISINAEKIPEKLLSKAIIAKKDSKNKITSLGGKYINGFITSKSKTFGTFYILLDTIVPTILPLNISDGKNMSTETSIKFKVTDNISDIQTYDGYVDDKWILFKYDGKNDLIYYDFDKKVEKGEHFLKFIVLDERGNENVFTAKFTK